MDYSLLAGVDRSGSPGSAGATLVVGVIDYLRRYTWDKRLETYVKYQAGVGGGGIGRELKEAGRRGTKAVPETPSRDISSRCPKSCSIGGEDGGGET